MRSFMIISVKGTQSWARIILPNLAIFSYQCIVTLTFDLLTRKSQGHILELVGSLCVKFHDDRCKGKVMRLDHFT